MKEHEWEPSLKQIAPILQKIPENILELRQAFASVESIQLPLPGTEEITVLGVDPNSINAWISG